MILMMRRFTQILVPLIMMLGIVACHHNPVSSDSTPVLVDYFPLKVGNQWTYSLSMYSDEAGEIYTWVNGTDIWRVLSSTSSDQGAVYTFQETVNITFIRCNLSNGFPLMDTIVYSDVTYPFTVADPSNHVLSFTFLSTSAGAESPSSWISRVVQNLGTKKVLFNSRFCPRVPFL